VDSTRIKFKTNPDFNHFSEFWPEKKFFLDAMVLVLHQKIQVVLDQLHFGKFESIQRIESTFNPTKEFQKKLIPTQHSSASALTFKD
jgi:hypothetical protein